MKVFLIYLLNRIIQPKNSLYVQRDSEPLVLDADTLRTVPLKCLFSGSQTELLRQYYQKVYIECISYFNIISIYRHFRYRQKISSQRMSI